MTDSNKAAPSLAVAPSSRTRPRRSRQVFLLACTALVVAAWSYLAWRLGSSAAERTLLALPCVLIWVVPAIYWGGRRRDATIADKIVTQASFFSMAWVSFLVVLTLVRDVVLVVTRPFALFADVHAFARDSGSTVVIGGALLAVMIGAANAAWGVRVRRLDLSFTDLHPDLDGLRIAQISDLHVGRNIRARYVQKIVALTKALDPDVVALTGDMVDGPVERLAPDVAALGELASGDRGFFILGNHDGYSGAQAWTAHFRSLGFRTLLNEHAVVAHRRARMVVAGVIDPTLWPGPRPDVALAGAPEGTFRLLLAHNPKSAPAAALAGFDLQLSGHTHGGQFFPWTLVVRRIHAPHSHGLSKEVRMWVYVSPGTGTWGPLVRLGTRPEVTLIRLMRRKGA
jgi:predicted MPP superfamily phosphohydrolase